MANNKSALKRWRQSIGRRDRNRSTRSAMRTQIRAVREAAAAGDEEAMKTALTSAFSSVDRAAKKGAIHTGKADRTKSRLAHLIARSTRA